MSHHGGNNTKPVIVAILANAVIAVSKAVGYFFSGSSALLSETIHSIADVMNQALLLIGIKRGSLGENEMFHYGHSQERFFWNLVSAMGIFVLGCGVTVYHGVHDLLHPTPFKQAGAEQYVIEIILLISLVMESYSFYVAVGEIRIQAQTRSKKFFAYLAESTDPSISAIFWEDLAAISGILLALFGIVLTNLTGDKTFDSAASILIGLLMGWIAYHLAIENKRFLTDRSIPDFEMRAIAKMLDDDKMIKSCSEIRTVVLGPDRLKFSAKVELDMKELLPAVVEAELTKHSKGKKTGVKPEELKTILSEYSVDLYEVQKKEIARVTKELESKVPNLKHVELRI
ncbi:MAG TPA: cation diffusion facilitator family transporter [Leptospiraceae bacterium]|nr:cation diffusion facilitator family transporter [Leptospiraceae bacterium]